jgi:hypothetical protein
MKTQSLRRFGLLLTLAAGALMARTAPSVAVPGTVNYIEGSVSLDGAALNASQAGQAALQQNQTLSTGDGKAEVLMSPGIFVRVGGNSEVRMVSPRLVDPRVEVVRGSAMVEVDNKLKEANVSVQVRDASASILKEGLYRFDADQGRISVFDGKLQISENGQSKEIGRGKEIVLDNDSTLKPVSFDRKAKDGLYVWSDVRSKYLADANASSAQYVYAGLGGYRGDGWFWNPYFSTWSWLPGNGYFYSPFGYPFYSLGYMPYYGGWYGGRSFHRPAIVGARPQGRVMPLASGFAGRGAMGGGRIGGGGLHGGGRR